MQNPYLQNRQLVTLEAREPSLTDGSHQKLCDIHSILTQYDKTGTVSHLNPNTPQYLDHTQLPTFQDLLNSNTQLNQEFEQLPSKLKKLFKTKEDLFNFISDPENQAEAEKLGLITLPSSQKDEFLQPIEQKNSSVTTEDNSN